jgi:transcriptional regulator with XRE-family HTH domain
MEERSLGEFVRRQRELQEVSLRQLAQLAGISNPYLSQIERGLRQPSERVLEAMAQALQVSADQLYEQAGRSRGEPDADVEPAVVSAIREDPGLTGRQRQALLEVYLSFTGQRRRRRSGS